MTDKRDIGQEILDGVREVKAHQRGQARLRSSTVEVPSQVRDIRERMALSQSTFAAMLGVSVRTLQDWEQGRRKPAGAARSLLLVAARQPLALKQAFRDASDGAQ